MALPTRSESAVRLKQMSRVLIVEDDEVIGQSMARHLAAAGFDPVWVDNGRQGLAKLRFEQPDV
jgi:DNA-binding response OmpR family regulator